MRNYQFFNGE